MLGKKIICENIDTLKTKLRYCFPDIPEDPIFFDNKDAIYKTLFHINDKSYTKEYESSKQKSLQINNNDIACDGCGNILSSYEAEYDKDTREILCVSCAATGSEKWGKISEQHTYSDKVSER